MTPPSEAYSYALVPPVSRHALIQELAARGLADAHETNCDGGLGKIVTDSRVIESGSIFVAIKGGHADGHAHISRAAAAGAKLIICEQVDPSVSRSLQLVVRSSREAWAFACSLAWNHPQKKLSFIGVTGTNGKTSTVWMVRSILQSLGFKTATIGTLGFYLGDEHFETKHTTPDPDVLYGMFQRAVDAGCRYLAMEVSSHALVQRKLSPLTFSAAAFTSFTQDHLDFHGSMDAYFQAKMSLFNELMGESAAVFVHASFCSSVKKSLTKNLCLVTYSSVSDACDVTVSAVPSAMRGHTKVAVKDSSGLSLNGDLPFIGTIFSENFAAAALLASSVTSEVDVSRGQDKIFKDLTPIPGRMSPLTSSKVGRPLVLIDSAHTPDALEKALAIARGVTPKKLWCVFGCGGDRDKLKRPLMGKISASLADYVVITSDNSRSESTSDILQDIASGISNKVNVLMQPDRHLAIMQAIQSSGLGDTILLAGKGHEDYQIIGTQIRHFSDTEEGQAALNASKKWCVIGAGVSGIGVAGLLRRQGDAVVVSDGGKVSEQSRKLLLQEGVEIFEGRHDVEHLKSVSAVALSPGVSETNILLREALARNLPVASEIDLGLESFCGSLIAVTGTNGKSTTCALLEHALTKLGLVATACGNIGLPPSALPDDRRTSTAHLICELSSYQLEQSIGVRCDVAIVTSFSFDHLARHGSMERYFACKWVVTEHIKPDGLLLLRGDAFLQALAFSSQFPHRRTVVVHDKKPTKPSQKHSFIEHWWLEGGLVLCEKGLIFDGARFQLAGTHNLVNAVFVLASLNHLTGRSYSELSPCLSGFAGLPFRCQVVGATVKGLPIVNDSKSTNVESTLVAISSTKGPLILLVGGAGKGESFSEITSISSRIIQVIAFGASRDEVVRDLAKKIPTSSHASLRDAVFEAMRLSAENSASVLFSPACASFDEFKNYEHRGQMFNQWVSEGREPK